ncbi:MAG: 3-oxoacyl-ACP reductase FabG [Candidatus Anaerobiospirillum merdipullorum]|uniref:3-oxoacyl-ACP reductase FabG n=1 Tax=Candidatus Anaerobiospirillum merdipullorum TaxID=2838450 RepID=A0A9E2KPN6_9GAMM|nr:3-oxoacyl-ACP reductase FabG [Candidatus Anaerobiospirillum merdipullorum]
MFASLADKTVFITGASHGIGLAMANTFAKEGCALALCARNFSKVQSVVEKLKEQGANAIALQCDVRFKEDLLEAVDACAQKFGSIDILCSNAGIFPQTPLEQISEEEYDAVMDTNVKGTFFAVQACVPYMKKRHWGRVILTSSITGPNTGYPGWAHYGASKAAQLGFMHTAALELAPFGITVNAVSPGNVISEGLQALGDDYVAQMNASVPRGQMGTTEDIANAALFLASHEASYINGHNLIIDGAQIWPESSGALEAIRSIAKD